MGTWIDRGRPWWAWVAVLGLVAAGLAGCGGGSEGRQASLRLVNAAQGYAALDLYVDDARRATAVARGTASGYAAVTAGSAVSTVLTSAGSTTALSTVSRTLTRDTPYTLVAHGWAGALKVALLQDDVAAAASGKAKLLVMNLGTDAGALDVYLTGEAESLDDAVAVAGSVAAGGTAGHLTLGAATYRLRVTGAGDKSDLRLDVSGVALASTQVATLLLTPATGGVLVDGHLLVQQGSATALANTRARARVVAAVGGNGRVSASLAGTPVASALTAPGVGGYTLVASGNAVPLVLSVNGSAVAVPAPALPAGGDHTLLVWGPAAAPQLAVLSDDNRLPTGSSQARLRLVNGLSGPGAGLDLEADFSAVAGNVAAGTASAYGLVNASTAMRLEVKSPLSANPLYSLTDARIDARGVYTVFMLGDAAGPQALLRRER